MDWSETCKVVHTKKIKNISPVPHKVKYRKYRGFVGHNLGIIRDVPSSTKNPNQFYDEIIKSAKKCCELHYPRCVSFSVHRDYGVKLFTPKAFPLVPSNAWNTYVISLLPWSIEKQLWIGVRKGGEKCVLAKLNDDVLKYILKFLQFDPFSERMRFRKSTDYDFIVEL